jgi:hypothetical protein
MFFKFDVYQIFSYLLAKIAHWQSEVYVNELYSVGLEGSNLRNRYGIELGSLRKRHLICVKNL